MTSTFAVGHVIAMEAGGQFLFWRRVFEEVTCKLLNRELVERKVAVEGSDHPVTPRPIRTCRILLVSVGVRVTSGIQPPHRHAFTVMG